MKNKFKLSTNIKRYSASPVEREMQSKILMRCQFTPIRLTELTNRHLKAARMWKRWVLNLLRKYSGHIYKK